MAESIDNHRRLRNDKAAVLRIDNYTGEDLQIKTFTVGESEAWCLYGDNDSGLSSLVELLADETTRAEEIAITGHPAVISFAGQQELFEEEIRKDESDYLDHVDPGTPARSFIGDIEAHRHLIDAFGFRHCLERGYRQLSSGESRKLLIITSLSHKTDLLIIENPYDGLDEASCRELDCILETLPSQGYAVLVTANNPGDIPPWCTYLGVMRLGKIVHQGLRSEIMPTIEKVAPDRTATFKTDTLCTARQQHDAELVRLRDGFARYGDTLIFSGLHLRVVEGQHTLVTGPNGCGKSTLLQIITGDNQNCYANSLDIFGRKRGSGESIWELKKQMGIVSPDLHRNYYIPGSALQVVLSGFFDSIGIYTHFSSKQKTEALRWLEMIGMSDRAQRPFRTLSFAQQRLCLIARALIKMPRLLILDEPTQGLDHHNRTALLDFLETVCEKRISTLIYASHRRDEFRSFFRQHIDFSKR
ncbi:MAG TPA: ATP-binding cassette domain-containing protein [Desulfopila sp.]|nr:ATP-binding cassette domain-containing protein [Desulfopila sp.]